MIKLMLCDTLGVVRATMELRAEDLAPIGSPEDLTETALRIALPQGTQQLRHGYSSLDAWALMTVHADE